MCYIARRKVLRQGRRHSRSCTAMGKGNGGDEGGAMQKQVGRRKTQENVRSKRNL